MVTNTDHIVSLAAVFWMSRNAPVGGALRVIPKTAARETTDHREICNFNRVKLQDIKVEQKPEKGFIVASSF